MWIFKNIKTRRFSKIMRVSNNTKYFQDGSYVQYQSKFDENNNWLESRGVGSFA